MKKTTYDGNDYLISDTAIVYHVTHTGGKTRWHRVYDMALALAVRENDTRRGIDWEDEMHADWMDEQSSLDSERPGLW